jgi:hypothetical protein
MDRTFSRRIVLGLSLGVAFGLALAEPAAAQGAGPYQFHTLTPCRLADTRNAVGPSGGPILTSLQTRNFPVQGICNVPVGAKAVAINVTAVGPNGDGYLTLFPSGGSRPVVSSINYAAGEPAIANGGIVPLSTSALDLSVFAFCNVVSGGAVHMVLDVTGYFQ